jgi:anti-sigma factor (TIGR02949 family)
VSGADTPDCGAQCQEALAQLERYLDGELPDATVDDIRGHLQACYPCMDRASFEEQLRAIVRRDCVDAPPPSLLHRIRDHLAAVDADG